MQTASTLTGLNTPVHSKQRIALQGLNVVVAALTSAVQVEEPLEYPEPEAGTLLQAAEWVCPLKPV